MAKKGKTSKNSNQKASYVRYKTEDRHYKNKVAKMTRYVKNNPNDELARERLISIVKAGVFPYTRNRKALKPNSTTQKVVRRVKGYNTTFNTYFDRIVPKAASIVVNKA